MQLVMSSCFTLLLHCQVFALRRSIMSLVLHKCTKCFKNMILKNAFLDGESKNKNKQICKHANLFIEIKFN